uniref:Secreted protein n=1 Tax=Haemonchus contortus TaxID=6289 RepID=A0A7I4XTZ0_HAECO
MHQIARGIYFCFAVLGSNIHIDTWDGDTSFTSTIARSFLGQKSYQKESRPEGIPEAPIFAPYICKQVLRSIDAELSFRAEVPCITTVELESLRTSCNLVVTPFLLDLIMRNFYIWSVGLYCEYSPLSTCNLIMFQIFRRA